MAFHTIEFLIILKLFYIISKKKKPQRSSILKNFPRKLLSSPLLDVWSSLACLVSFQYKMLMYKVITTTHTQEEKEQDRKGRGGWEREGGKNPRKVIPVMRQLVREMLSVVSLSHMFSVGDSGTCPWCKSLWLCMKNLLIGKIDFFIFLMNGLNYYRSGNSGHLVHLNIAHWDRLIWRKMGLQICWCRSDFVSLSGDENCVINKLKNILWCCL